MNKSAMWIGSVLVGALVTQGTACDSSGRAASAVGEESVPFDQRPFRDEVFYFLLTDRFYNADPANDRGLIEGDRLAHGFDPTDMMFYNGGDLKGVTKKLDYLADLGVTALWITPVFQNRPIQDHDGWLTAAYHGYWIEDFTRVDPHLGTEAEFRELVREAHHRDMKVFLDIVVNHTADVIKYRQCHDPDFAGEDKSAPGSGCKFRSTADYPYTTRGRADGEPINNGFLGVDETHQNPENFSRLSDPGYAFTPYIKDADKDSKNPAWLNDPVYFHNRGELVFSGEAFYSGDFFGLDDVFTEHPRVVNGMIDIYEYWIREFGIDGYRIDTAGHVNISFFSQFSPALLQTAEENDRPEFFMFGEVVDDVLDKRHYLTRGKLPAVLDFDFYEAIVDYVAAAGSAKHFADSFRNDDYFVSKDSSPYVLPTFIGNHDTGRFPVKLQKYDPSASESLRLKRLQLAQAILFYSRGVPILYYGTEQGFVGEPGFHESREDMFASQVDVFNDNDLLGTELTTAADNFDIDHVNYMFLKELSGVYRQHPALRRGGQYPRYSDDESGVVAFSRIDPDDPTEYLVVFNNSQAERNATIPVYTRDAEWSIISGAATDVAGGVGQVSLLIPPVEHVVLKASDSIPVHDSTPAFRFSGFDDGDTLECDGFVNVTVETDALTHIDFSVQSDGGWQSIGTDTNYPYRIYIETRNYDPGSTIRLRASTSAYSTESRSATINLEIPISQENCE